ncbi:hypothetical protein YQE_02709, partial [Dendroctonus ponderosae]
MATNIVMTQEMLQQLLAGVMINVPRNLEPVPALRPEGNFVDCKSRFSGKRTESVDAFIDGIIVYKQCANVSDANALLGLSMLLDSDAATWWQGAKTTATSWKDAMEALQHAFGRNQPPYQIYRELFSREQGKEPTDIFINKARALLAKLPSTDEPIPIKSQIDMIYGLLHTRIRRNIPRDSIDSFEIVIANNLSRARENCERCQDAFKALQDRHRREDENYQPGEKVLIDVHALSKASLGFSAKFAPRRDGHYVILKKISPTTYQIAEVGKPDSPLGTYHVSAIRRFVGNDDPDPRPVVPIRKRGRPRKNTI